MKRILLLALFSLLGAAIVAFSIVGDSAVAEHRKTNQKEQSSSVGMTYRGKMGLNIGGGLILPFDGSGMGFGFGF